MKNEQAFPFTKDGSIASHTNYHAGLSKREYIAIHAMQGLIANGDKGDDYVAKYAVRYADALINELNKQS